MSNSGLRALAVFLLVSTAVGSAAAEDEPKGKFSGYAFGDLYWFARDHRDDVEGQWGAWFRRIYLTYDRTIDPCFEARIRLEARSQGDFGTDPNRIEPFFKDLYLKWNRERNQVWFGLSPTPTWEFVEGFWGYRSLERTVLDLQRAGEARDLGIALTGQVGSFSYHVMVGNGAGVDGETNRGKAIAGAVRTKLGKSLEVELYADHNDRPDGVDLSTLQWVWAIRCRNGRIGVQLAHQEYSGAPDRDDFDVVSAFGVLELSDRVAVIGRYDRAFDPNPQAEDILYLPMASSAESNFLLAAVDFTVHEHIHVMPNVEAVIYGDPVTGGTPPSDVVPRLTLLFSF